MTRQQGSKAGRSGADPGGATAAGPSVPERSHDGLLRLLGLVLLARGLLSLVDAAAIATGGVGLVEPGGAAFTDGSAVWPVVWGAVALSAAVLLFVRRPLGWVLATGVSVAYLVGGVARTVDAASAPAGLPMGVWLVFAIDVLVPALVLAGLFTVRPWFLAAARARTQARVTGR